jgi:hypothetical protein
MKGTLHKTEIGWVVEYMVDERTPIGHKSWWEMIPLHPDNVKEIEEDSKIFDNIEARIAAYPEVEFEIIEECGNYDHFGKDCSCKLKFIPYAKLIKTEYPELEGTMNLCTDIINKKRTGKMTEEEWQEAERAQTSTKTAMTSIEWLETMLMNEYRPLSDYAIRAIAKAKEMHREEILDAYIDRMDCTSKEEMRRILGGQYYQEKFGLKK